MTESGTSLLRGRPETRCEGSSGKPRVLAVIPFGMALRNIVLNEALWGYLRNRFEIDLVSPVRITNPAELGIARILTPPSRYSMRRVLRAVNARFVHRLRLMDYARFFLTSREAEAFAVNCASLGHRTTSQILLWSAINYSRLDRPMRRLLGSLVRFHPNHPVDAGAYRFILVGHTGEHECVTYARLANRIGLPVVCIAMGVDNIAAEPLAFRPDLLLMWGEEMRRDFRSYQMSIAPDLARTRLALVGSTVYDNYLHCDDRLGFLREFDLDPDDEVILFPAHVEASLPHQTKVAEIVIEFIQAHQLRVRLLVRMRPGIDRPMWRAFADRFPNEVRLQEPAAASFDKSGMVHVFDLEHERKEVQAFARTIKNVTLTVNPSFSTMALDSMAFGKPVLNAIFNAGNEQVLHRDLLWYLMIAEKTPVWKRMMVARSREEFLDMLTEFFVHRRRERFHDPEIVRYRATAVDGRCGERAAAAIDRFLNGLPVEVPAAGTPAVSQGEVINAGR